MKKHAGIWVIGALGALLVGGCASDTVVKKDEAVAPSATTQAKPSDVKSRGNMSDATSTIPVPAKNITNAGNTSSNQAMEQMKSALDKIYFDFDSYGLSDQARSALTNNADYLQKHATANIRIEGNCDERGSAEYNIALGEKRAKAAMKYLAAMGIPEKRLTTISYGKEKPADTAHDEAAWAKNRRDDFTIVSK